MFTMGIVHIICDFASKARGILYHDIALCLCFVSSRLVGCLRNLQVSIRPFTHNEYERFLVAAYPYYASALSVMVGFLVFCAAFLYSGKGASKCSAGSSGASVVVK